MQFEVSQISLQGDRKNNQDRVGYIEYDYGAVLILGDGLGGRPKGELAAQTLIDTVEKALQNSPMPIPDPFDFLEGALLQAHNDVMAVGREQIPPVEPGTTAVLCLIQNGSAWWAHIGDSRCYLFRHGLSIYRTQDHSYVEDLYKNGEISLSKVSTHPMRNYITRCVGMLVKEPEVDLSKEVMLIEGDIILLCSDGFWGPLDDAQIGAKLNNNRLNNAITTLAENARQLGAPTADNTTVIALKIISLQLLNQTSSNKSQEIHVKQPAVDSAIKEIENAIDTYGHEMDD